MPSRGLADLVDADLPDLLVVFSCDGLDGHEDLFGPASISFSPVNTVVDGAIDVGHQSTTSSSESETVVSLPRRRPRMRPDRIGVGGWFALTALGLLILGRIGGVMGAPGNLAGWGDQAALYVAILVPGARAVRALWRRSYTTSGLLTVAGLGAAACGAAASGAIMIMSCGALDAWQRQIWRTTWRRLDRRARLQGGRGGGWESLETLEQRALRRGEVLARPFVLLGVGTALLLLPAPFLFGDPVSVWLQRAAACLVVAMPGGLFTAVLFSQLHDQTGAAGASGVPAVARVPFGHAGLLALGFKTGLLVAAGRGDIGLAGVMGWEAGMICVMGIGVLWSGQRLVRGRFEPRLARAYNKRA